MALSSKCPRCQHSGFEVAIESPSGSNYKLAFVRCSSCGTVVGVTEYYNIGARLSELAKLLGRDLPG